MDRLSATEVLEAMGGYVRVRQPNAAATVIAEDYLDRKGWVPARSEMSTSSCAVRTNHAA